MKLDVNSLERLTPDHVRIGDVTGSESLKLHLTRYAFAAFCARPGRLLDIACGSGYGTKLLAEQSQGVIKAVGVDISEDAIAYARYRYRDARVEFIAADATNFTDPEGFDTIVSLETIEHLPDPEGFISHLVSLLLPNGVFIGSVPTTPSVDANPHHLHDFSERSFRRMVERHGLKEIDCLRQVQPFRLMSVLKRRESRARDVRPDLLSYYLAHPSSLARRVWSTLIYGFTNRYITIAWTTDD